MRLYAGGKRICIHVQTDTHTYTLLAQRGIRKILSGFSVYKYRYMSKNYSKSAFYIKPGDYIRARHYKYGIVVV